MKKSLLYLAFSLTLSAHAQIYWNFGTTNSSPEPSANSYHLQLGAGSITAGNLNGTVSNLINSTSASSSYGGASGLYNAGIPVRSGVFNLNSSTYFEFTITPQASNLSIQLKDISFGSRATSSGPAALCIRTSKDNYSSNIATSAINPNSSWALISITSLAVQGDAGKPLTVRIYGYNGTDANTSVVNWRIDDLTIGQTTLPVSLTAFYAKRFKDHIHLKWTTASESDHSKFELMRAGKDRIFHRINTIAAKGYASSYIFNDYEKLPGTVYYKLVQKDQNGTQTSSNIIKSDELPEVHLNVETISDDAIAFTISSANPASGRLTITDISGNVSVDKKIQIEKGLTALKLPVMQQGMLIAVLETAEGRSAIKLHK